MTVSYQPADNGGYIALGGELDHHAASAAIRKLHTLLDDYQPGHVTLDLSALSFMDSSGLALLTCVKRRMDNVRGSLTVENVPRQAYRVLTSAGMDKLFTITEKGSATV